MKSPHDFERRLSEFGKTLRERESIEQQIMARIDSADLATNESASGKSRRGYFHFGSRFGDISMKQRFTLGGMTAAAIVTMLFLTLDFSSSNVFADVIQNIRRAKTYSMNMTMEGKRPGFPKMTQKFYWKSPGHIRTERERPLLQIPGQEIDTSQLPDGLAHVEILSVQKTGISINHIDRTFNFEDAQKGYQPRLMMLESLAKYEGDSREDLGEETINGVRSVGFGVPVDEIEPSAGAGTMNVWVDINTQLPTKITVEMEDMPALLTMHDFTWNQDLSDSLFNTTPPEGYTDKTRPKEDLASRVKKVREAFKYYAKLSGGHYPRGKMVYGDVTRNEMLKFAGYELPIQPDWFKDKAYQEIVGVTGGFSRVNSILRDNPDASYHGIDVGPEDADKVLMRWKLTDGRYQILYGDLRGEIVTADSPRSLE